MPDHVFEHRCTITSELVAAYGGVSGDDNAIHTDPVAASEAGLPAPIAHGMLTAGIALRKAQLWAATSGRQVIGYETRFVKPVYVSPGIGTNVLITATSDTGDRLDMRVSVIAADGTETVVLRPLRVYLASRS